MDRDVQVKEGIVKVTVLSLSVVVAVDESVEFPENENLAVRAAEELVYPLGLFLDGTDTKDWETFTMRFTDGGWGHEGESGEWKWEGLPDEDD